MRILETQEKGAGDEVQLTDAMAQLIGNQPFHGFTSTVSATIAATRRGKSKANVTLVLVRDDIGPVIRDFARALLA